VSVASTLQIKTDDVEYIDAEGTTGGNRFTVSRAVGSQVVNVDFASNPTNLTDQVGAIRTYQDGVSLSDSLSFQKNGQATFSERVKVEADSTATTQSVAVIQSSTTNAGLVLNPNGTGAIMASVPNGTATGGNARGQYSVDLQLLRDNANQVASAYGSFIGGGFKNKATNTGAVVVGGEENTSSGLQYSFVGGGFRNTASGTRSVVVGGNTNTASDQQAFVGGGSTNTASKDFAVVVGGQSNTASTNTHATVVGGQSNTSSGLHSISGGLGSTASGQRGIALGGYSTASGGFSLAIGDANTASGTKSVVLGADSRATQTASVAIGNVVYSEAENSFVTGNRTLGYLYGQNANASGRFTGNGDAQQSLLTARKSDTLASASTTVLSLDGTGTTNLIIPDGSNRAWNVTVKWVAVVTAANGAAGIIDGDSIASTEQLLFKRVAGTSSVVGSASTISTHSDASMAGCSMAYTAGASQELALTFTGPTFAAGGPVDCRIVAKVELTEVAW